MNRLDETIDSGLYAGLARQVRAAREADHVPEVERLKLLADQIEVSYQTALSIEGLARPAYRLRQALNITRAKIDYLEYQQNHIGG